MDDAEDRTMNTPVYRVGGVCPWCQHEMKYAAPIKGSSGPTPGNFTVCRHCSGISVYADRLDRRKVTQEDLDGADPEVREIILAEVARVTVKRVGGDNE